MKRIRKSLAILLAAALSFGTVTIAAAEGNAVAIDKEAFDSLLAAGKTADDAVFATYSITPSRQEVISFAGPYYTSRQAVLVKAGNEDIGGVDDLSSASKWPPSGRSLSRYPSPPAASSQKYCVPV